MCEGGGGDLVICTALRPDIRDNDNIQMDPRVLPRMAWQIPLLFGRRG
jgi:hypothetical protein